jgi:hypothetical protein
MAKRHAVALDQFQLRIVGNLLDVVHIRSRSHNAALLTIHTHRMPTQEPRPKHPPGTVISTRSGTASESVKLMLNLIRERLMLYAVP